MSRVDVDDNFTRGVPCHEIPERLSHLGQLEDILFVHHRPQGSLTQLRIHPIQLVVLALELGVL